MPNKHIKHAPWVFEHFDSQIGDTGDYSHCDRITGSNGKVIICDIWDGDEDSCAHARLIAAAPKLLAACRAFCRAMIEAKADLDAEKNAIRHAYDLARAAIAEVEAQ